MQTFIRQFEELTTAELYEILQLRVAVFVVEQNCAYMEIDGKDLYSHHIMIKDQGCIKAYLRIVLPQTSNDELSIGRVIATERGKGLGKAIMLAGLQTAKDKLGAEKVHIEAQSYAKGFYQQLGFEQTSNEFLEDGIPHIKMVASL